MAGLLLYQNIRGGWTRSRSRDTAGGRARKHAHRWVSHGTTTSTTSSTTCLLGRHPPRTRCRTSVWMRAASGPPLGAETRIVYTRTAVASSRACLCAGVASAPPPPPPPPPHRETTDACSASPLKPARAGRSAAFFAVHFGDLPGEEPAADAFEYVCPITAAHSDANGSKPHREATDAFSASPLKPAHARPFVSGFALAWGVGDLPRSELAADALDEYVCPITAEIMSDPVCTMDGITYERITAWSNGPSWQCPSSAASCASSGRAWRGSGQLGNSSQARARASHTGIPARSQQLPHLLKPVASEGAQYHYL